MLPLCKGSVQYIFIMGKMGAYLQCKSGGAELDAEESLSDLAMKNVKSSKYKVEQSC